MSLRIASLLTQQNAINSKDAKWLRRFMGAGDSSRQRSPVWKDVRHPISVVRQVKERLPHVLLMGDGAKRFADPASRERGVLDFANSTTNPRVIGLAMALDTWRWDVLGSGKERARLDALAPAFRV